MPPLVVLVAESFPPGDASVQPIALQSYNNTSLLDHWWHSLSAHSLFNPARVYIVTNAIYYKAIEFWSIGRGLDVSHVVNTGCSLGDARCGAGGTRDRPLITSLEIMAKPCE